MHRRFLVAALCASAAAATLAPAPSFAGVMPVAERAAVAPSSQVDQVHWRSCTNRHYRWHSSHYGWSRHRYGMFAPRAYGYSRRAVYGFGAPAVYGAAGPACGAYGAASVATPGYGCCGTYGYAGDGGLFGLGFGGGGLLGLGLGPL